MTDEEIQAWRGYIVSISQSKEESELGTDQVVYCSIIAWIAMVIISSTIEVK